MTSRKVYSKSIHHTNKNSTRSENVPSKDLKLMMISCEDEPPYGPSSNVAEMFLELLSNAYLQSHQYKVLNFSITVYEAKQKDYPIEEEWDMFDGILLPGSFSSAYDSDEWIQHLKRVIQTEIHKRERKTLAICFGHQVVAHSFADSNCPKQQQPCIPCPASIQLGPRNFENASSTSNTNDMNGKSILYTHGDMVQKLPDCAESLGGNQSVPIQGAVYYTKESKKPFIYSFQGHPEYASELGLKTFNDILQWMDNNDKMPKEYITTAKLNAVERFDKIHRDSIKTMHTVAHDFNWM
ncbi:hypothetical protein CTEN210_07370 [Chaetoceros tenuissimus]|uniref:Glutamine amidotransferase domain-containing protein n=1 Tax=Chaetoceros tenuissimus TaxID=426638 RepID=A0AAD3CUM3_9STRA|nr:hypothetical protein CTEN210_07370 [Chaetoceros tenuissimus]